MNIEQSPTSGGEELDSLTSDGYNFDMDAGWEFRADKDSPDRAICRWCFIYLYLLDDDENDILDENGLPNIVGVAAGYAGGGTFMLEQFYLVGDNPDNIVKLYFEGGSNVVSASKSTDSWEDLDATIIDAAEAAYNTFMKWHDEDIWGERDQLHLKPNKWGDEMVSKQNDMLYVLTDDDDPWTTTIGEHLGLTARRSGP